MWLEVMKNAHNIHALVGIQTFDPSITSVQDYARLELHGHRNRHKRLEYQRGLNSELGGTKVRTTSKVRMTDIFLLLSRHAMA
jgi:hypothetical protein